MSRSAGDQITQEGEGVASIAPEVGLAPADRSDAAPEAAPPPPSSAEGEAWNPKRAIVRLTLSIGIFFVIMAIVAKLFSSQIEIAGRLFVDRFGVVGMGLGTMIADAFSLPPPSIFYIVVVATSRASHLYGMSVICVGSLIGANIGYHASSLLASRPFFQRRIDATRARMDKLFAKYGVWAFAIASATPLPFSFLCYVAGVYRVGPKLFAVVCAFRIPRLLVLYYLVRAGWVTGGGG